MADAPFSPLVVLVKHWWQMHHFHRWWCWSSTGGRCTIFTVGGAAGGRCTIFTFGGAGLALVALVANTPFGGADTISTMGWCWYNKYHLHHFGVLIQ